PGFRVLLSGAGAGVLGGHGNVDHPADPSAGCDAPAVVPRESPGAPAGAGRTRGAGRPGRDVHASGTLVTAQNGVSGPAGRAVEPTILRLVCPRGTRRIFCHCEARRAEAISWHVGLRCWASSWWARPAGRLWCGA